MSDPLSQMIGLLRPRTVFSKGIVGAGAWAVRYAPFGYPSFCVILEGGCRLDVDGHPSLTLQAGDFLLLPATPGFSMSGLDPESSLRLASAIPREPEVSSPGSGHPSSGGEIRHGRLDGPPDVRLLGGYFLLASPDAPLLVSLLPDVVHVRGEARLDTLVRLVGDEADECRTGRDLILGRLVEVLLVEALRRAPGSGTPSGLLRGLADERIAPSIHAIHRAPAEPWTGPRLARVAALSRAAFFERFRRSVGMTPMAYLLSWRMALARDLLRQGNMRVEEVARRVGYNSASTFSTAFRRVTGVSPGRYRRGVVDRA